MINFYIIATPIGNYEDITLRAINILKKVDFIVCEQEREYKKLFGIVGIKEKKFILCNEHNEEESIDMVIPLLKKGEKGALISDCGTPLFEDPGFKLVESIRKNGYKITSLPGANSLITTLSLSPFKINKFYYAGFLPQKKEERKIELLRLLKRKEAIILIEAPYRLKNILSLLKELIYSRRIFISYNLTMADEELFWGSPIEVEQMILSKKINKGEFLVIIEEIK
ncbi:MAG: 16S rRNA (cytidine(1402)-2'-O)-methyltransferase [Spirochaetes bacterium]|nr:16S rRNA (cytidine(1402)-2'-O)-methyltransferase [Spirochaetota bacterium]